MLLDVYKIDGSLAAEKLEVADSVFGVEPNQHSIYLTVKAFLANQRQGTSKAKERSEVSGGGKKPWRQKGRGGARAGSSRSPLWVGGGTIFGPKPRDHRQYINKKVKALAKKSALSHKIKDEQFLVLEDFNFENIKTAQFVDILKKLKVDAKKVTLLTNGTLQNVYKSGRNIDKVKVLEAQSASTYDILNNQVLLVQKSAVEFLNNQLTGNVTAVN
ncbi:MAG: 50S ribosomal protein L4 [Ignavibacteriaceae bacterium]|nr:50S ribosomal protein L4 [Ignavibacteriaceae bacterium]